MIGYQLIKPELYYYSCKVKCYFDGPFIGKGVPRIEKEILDPIIIIIIIIIIGVYVYENDYYYTHV